MKKLILAVMILLAVTATQAQLLKNYATYSGDTEQLVWNLSELQAYFGVSAGFDTVTTTWHYRLNMAAVRYDTLFVYRYATYETEEGNTEVDYTNIISITPYKPISAFSGVHAIYDVNGKCNIRVKSTRTYCFRQICVWY